MSTVNDSLRSPGGAVALESISIFFNAAQLALGALRPPFKTQIAPAPTVTPGPTGIAVLDVITIDATLQEIHGAQSEVTEHPVEQGADITDHVRPRPREVRLDGLITETPIDDSLVTAAVRAAPLVGFAVGTIQTAQSLLTGSSIVRGAFDKLQALRDSGLPVQLFTKYRAYSSMVLYDLQITRDPHTGEAIRFGAAFREVITVSSALTTIQLPALAQAAQDVGTQGTPAASAKITNDSVLWISTGAQTSTFDNLKIRAGVH